MPRLVQGAQPRYAFGLHVPQKLREDVGALLTGDGAVAPAAVDNWQVADPKNFEGYITTRDI